MTRWLQTIRSVDPATAVAEAVHRCAAWLGRVPWVTVYPAALLLFALVVQLKSPIVVGDTDMWYHLSGGRYFWNEGRPPDTPFFSFNGPEREWVNYFWGFQAIVYKIYEAWGYVGLVAARATLSVLGLLAVWRFISGYRETAASTLPLLVLFALFVILLDGRAAQLRPHLVSYALIPAFLYVLEHRPRYAPVLPLATVLWVNLHGVEYVVAALVLAAYLLDALARHRAAGAAARVDWRYVASILACAPALLVNPFGAALLGAPFAHPQDLSEYVSEMRPISWETVYTVIVKGLWIEASSAFALLAAASVAAAVASVARGRLRLAHLVLAAGGVLLLVRGHRFIWEWALLTLPLLASAAAAMRRHPDTPQAIRPALLAGAFLLSTPFVALAKNHKNSTGYPFRTEGLPTGTIQLAKQEGLAGNVLMNPSLAGYVHWELSPAVRVYADMELPPFGDWDLYRVFAASRDEVALRRLLSEHTVDFLMVEVANKALGAHAKKLGAFAPVFFDDVMVLLAHRERQPELVRRHEIRNVNPFNLLDAAHPLADRLEELRHIAEAYPEGNRVNHAITRLLFDDKQYAEAEVWAQRFLAHHPADPNSLYLMGAILENTGRCASAVPLYERAFDTADGGFHPVLHQHLGTCHYLTQDFATAYAAFRQGVNIYLRSEPPETLYQYAFSSVIVGDTARARLLLQAILYETPDAEEKVRSRAEGLLARLDAEPSLASGLPAWMKALMP